MSLFIYFLMVLLSQPVHKVCIDHRSWFVSFNLFNRRISIELIQWLGYIGLLSILSSDTRLFSSFIYFMANMERGAYPTMRNEIDHQFISMFYKTVCNFFSAMTSVNETSIHSTFVQYLYLLHPLKRKKMYHPFMSLWFHFVMGFGSAAHYIIISNRFDCKRTIYVL